VEPWCKDDECEAQYELQQGRASAKAPSNMLLRRLWYTKRTLTIWRHVCGQAVSLALLKRRNLRGQALVEARTAAAAKLRDTLILLGPTFIKIGQLLSTRVDVLPPEVITELARLQNQCPSFPGERALAVIKKELGKGVDELYEKFDPTPIAAASLAQVHRAVLRTGEEVVVKVQRENLVDLFHVDLWNIKLVAMLADRLDPQTEAVASNWEGIADASGRVLFQEVDFTHETRSAISFRENFLDNPAIKVPEVFTNLSTSRVITMEYCPGVKISSAEQLEKEGFDPIQISTNLVTSYLEQVCHHGFFHCDPHPGNLAVDNGYPGGRLIYYDFGMMERMQTDIKKGFVDLIFSIYENLPREACDALEAMGVLRPDIDRSSIEKISREMLNQFQTTLASADNKWENMMTEEEKKASRRARRAKLGQDLFATQAERPFLFPPTWSFVFRAFSTIDGLCKGLDRKFDLSRISQPYLRELASLRDGSTTTTALKELGRRTGLRPKDIGELVQQPRTVAAMADRVRRIEEGDVTLRVRTLQVERVLERVELRQRFIGAGLATAALYQLARNAAGQLLALQRTFFVVLALRCGWESFRAWAQLGKLETQRRRFANEGDERYDSDDVYASGV
jgi:predicted unusual protein kinase regulating ubiquinone biosynthesis (AarF/ABC1/UbiB family)